MQTNKFLEISSSPLMNLDHTYRYSGTKLVEPESLSQHITDTIMMGLKMIDAINHLAGDKILDVDKYIKKAIYHDLEEVITGDVPRPLKYFDEETHKSLEHVASQVANNLFREEFYEDSESHYNLWKFAKSGPEGYILKLVDMLVVVNKVVKEVNMLNNMYMLRVAHEVRQYTQSLRDSAVKSPYFGNVSVQDYIKDVLTGAINVLDDILSSNYTTLRDMHLEKQSMI